jgi:hypothetical protein
VWYFLVKSTSIAGKECNIGIEGETVTPSHTIYRLSNGGNLPWSNSVSIIRIITLMFPLTFWERAIREFCGISTT